MNHSGALSMLLLFALCVMPCCRSEASPATALPPAEPEETQPAEDAVLMPQSPGGETVPTPTPRSPDKDVTPAPGTDGSVPTDPPSSVTPFPFTSQDAVETAVANLAARLGIDRTRIQVIEVTRQEFPLPDLGCPPPDGKGHESPLPAVVFGQLVRLRANDLTYEYRIRGLDIRFCGALGD